MCLRDKLSILLLLMVMISLTNFATQYFVIISIISLFLLLLQFFLYLYRKRMRLFIETHIVLYFFSVVIFFLMSTAFSSRSINSLLFIPFISYISFIILYEKDNKLVILDFGLKLFVITLLVVAFIEVLVKLNILNVPFYENFVLTVGDRRIDVLRATTLFGSPLSTAAVSIAMMIYFIYFKYSSRFILLTFLLILLSGSRTPILVSAILVVGYFFSKRFDFIIRLKKINGFSVVIYLSLLGYAVYYLIGISDRIINIFLRSFDFASIKVSSEDPRAQTTLRTFLLVLEDIPRSFFLGIKENWVSDSAFASIMATSGVLIFLIYIGYMFYLIAKLNIIRNLRKTVIILALIVAGVLIGDALIQVVTYIIFLILFIYTNKYKKTQ